MPLNGSPIGLLLALTYSGQNNGETKLSSVTAKLYSGLGIVHAQQNDTGQADVTIGPGLDPITFSNGNAAGQVNAEFTDIRTIAASGSEELDLGDLVDGLNLDVAFGKIMAIEIRADPGNANDVIVGNAAAHSFQGPLSAAATHNIGPGDRLLWSRKVAGWAVVADTNDQLKIANSGAGTPVTYTIKIVGQTA